MTYEVQMVAGNHAGVGSYLVKMTPEIAAAYLARHAPNRPLSKPVVKAYADDMTAGHWTYNGQNLIIDRNGYLIDGQHRLSAVIKSGVSVDMGITYGVDRSTFDTIDTGRRRNGVDLMSMLGSQSSKIAAVITRTGLLLDSNESMSVVPGRRDMVDYYTKWSDKIEPVAEYGHTRFRRSVLTPGSIGTVMFMATRLDRYCFKDFTDFIEPVLNGEGLSKGDPRYALREWGINHRVRNGKVYPVPALWATIRAWQKWTADETLTQIRAPHDYIGWSDNFIPGEA